jgi:hypothetical protein
MKAKIFFNNGNALDLDNFATEMLLKTIHKQELGTSLVVLHFADKTGKMNYTIPMSSISYIDYID